MSSTHLPTADSETPAERARELQQIHEERSHVTPGEIAVGVVIGRASEYFDFFVYGIASVLVFPTLFFPFKDPLQATLWSFVIFSFAFIARPLGTVISMKIQTRFNREVKLTVALFLLGICTVGIAFLPGYATLGFGAVIVLSLLRTGQGLALGGSWDGLPSLLALNAPAGKRGWYAMIGQLGAPLGFVLASSLFAYLYSSLPQEDFLSFGWRYAFFVAFAINVVALFARLRLVATDEYRHMLEERELAPVPVSELAGTQGHNILIGAFAALASYALFHLITVFPLSWIRLNNPELLTRFLVVQVVGAFLCGAGVVGSGWLADRFGRRSTLGSLAIAIGVFSLAMPWLLSTSSGYIGKDLFLLVGFVLLGLSYGQAAGAVTANFELRYRYMGAALTSDVAWLIGAAFAPLVALGLAAHFGLPYVSIYLLSGVVCTLVALRLNKALTARSD
ncbi:MFS transporter [Variovorax dokdonensis]|uniref:MFS transporter n=1 Tax=Variovorax dokdonensis TaxID=344883 RepID=A0ABT7NDU1_9BURK|nr:MFS transporter [Variovorax dokdonensis]MDM0046103.1 MFS transporter [Variovorax dokdonensis]